MASEITTETVIEFPVNEFPSIFSASPEIALWFINNGFTESAKRVIQNLAERIEDLKEVANSEKENGDFWRTMADKAIEDAATQQNISGEWEALYFYMKQEHLNANLNKEHYKSLLEKEAKNGEFLANQNKVIAGINDDLIEDLKKVTAKNEKLKSIIENIRTIAEWDREYITNLEKEKVEYLVKNYRLEMAIGGLKKGYGKYKRAFLALKKRHNKTVNELSAANAEIARLKSENADLFIAAYL